MKITYDDFVGVCPSAMTPDTDIFDTLKNKFERRLLAVHDLVTADIYDQLDNIEDDLQNPHYERLCALRRAVIGYVCCNVYFEAIPQLDLVLTATGFGVVSNQNVAPASKERVAELARQIRRQECGYIDELLDLIRPIVDWEQSRGEFGINYLFWRGDHVRGFGIPNPTRDDLMRKMPEIIAATTKVKKLISPEEYDVLLNAERTDSLTSWQHYLMNMCRVYMVLSSADIPPGIGFQCQAIISFLEEHPDEFPAYHDSPTYHSRHFERYENKKDDTCYFFG